eukprot:Awhi_evm1s8801
MIQNKEYLIYKTFYFESKKDYEDLDALYGWSSKMPGDIIVEKEEFMIIKCKDYPLKLMEWEEMVGA